MPLGPAGKDRLRKTKVITEACAEARLKALEKKLDELLRRSTPQSAAEPRREQTTRSEPNHSTKQDVMRASRRSRNIVPSGSSRPNSIWQSIMKHEPKNSLIKHAISAPERDKPGARS